jgi:hypothetical protein
MPGCSKRPHSMKFPPPSMQSCYWDQFTGRSCIWTAPKSAPLYAISNSVQSALNVTFSDNINLIKSKPANRSMPHQCIDFQYCVVTWPLSVGTELSQQKVCWNLSIRFKEGTVILPFKAQWLLYAPSALTFRNFNHYVPQLRGTETDSL